MSGIKVEEGSSCCQSVKLPESRYSCVDGPMPANALAGLRTVKLQVSFRKRRIFSKEGLPHSEFRRNAWGQLYQCVYYPGWGSCKRQAQINPVLLGTHTQAASHTEGPVKQTAGKAGGRG